MKRVLFTLLFCAMFAGSAFGQSSLFRPSIGDNGKWGVRGDNGAVIVKFDYDLIAEFTDDSYIVTKFGRSRTIEDASFGIVGANGEVLLPVEYNEIGDFDMTGFAVLRKGAKYGIINRTFQFVVPCKYAAVGQFNEKGYVWVNEGGTCNIAQNGLVEGGMYGVFNAKGRLVIAPKYKNIGTFVRKKSKFAHPFTAFSNIPDFFKEIEQETESFDVFEYSYLDNRIMTQLDMSFDSLIVVSSTGTYRNDGIFDTQGRIVLPINTYELFFHPEDGIIPLARFEAGLLHTNYYVIKRQSQMFNNWPKVDCITSFKSDRAIVAVHGANQFINSQGLKLGHPYEIILPSSTGTYIVESRSRFGLMNNDGTEVIAPRYYIIHPIREGLMLAKLDYNAPVCYLNPSGDIAISTTYKVGTSFSNGTAQVGDGEKWGLIDSSGRQVLSCDWFYIKNPSDPTCPYIWVKLEKGSLYHCMDSRTYQLAFYEAYPNVNNFSEYYPDVAFVYNSEKKVGCINSRGEKIFPCVMHDIYCARDTYLSLLKDGKLRWTPQDVERWNKRETASALVFPIKQTIANSYWDY